MDLNSTDFWWGYLIGNLAQMILTPWVRKWWPRVFPPRTNAV